MVAIVTREVGATAKGSPLTNAEVDNNFINLEEGKIESPASATDNAVVRFDGTTGKLVQNSVVTIADSTGDVAGVGALTMGGNLTLSGGPANGVLYLNGSKVATSGSALTFDGTTLGATALSVTGNTTLGDASGDTLTINGTAVSIPNGLNFDSNLLVLDATNNYVGINRSTPIYPLDVNGIIRAAFANPDTSGIILQATTVTNAAAAQIINGAGNLYFGLDTSTGSRLLGTGSTGGYQGVLSLESNYPLVLGQNNTGRLYLLSGEAVINEPGTDYDFRVESDTNTHMLFVDAGNNRVGINDNTPQRTFSVQGGTDLILAGNNTTGGTLRLASNMTNSSVQYGVITQRQYALTAEPEGYALVAGTATSTNNYLSLGGGIDEQNMATQVRIFVGPNVSTRSSGVDYMAQYMDASQIVFNEGGYDQDFRVESDANTHMLFVDAGAGAIGINNSAPTALLELGTAGTANIANNFQTKVSDFAAANRFGTTGLTNNNDGIFFGMGVGSGIPAGLGFMREASGWNTQIRFYTNNITSGPDSTLAMQEKMRIESSAIVINETGADQDFRVESDTNTHALFVDAGVSKVGFNFSAPTNILHAGVPTPATLAGSSDGLVISTTSGTAYNTQLVRLGATYNYSGATGAPTVGAAMLYNYGGRFFFVGDGASASDFVFTTYGANRLQVGSDSYALVVNEDGLDYDFRVESDTNTHALFVDAGNNQVAITRSSTIKNLTIGVASAGNGIQIANSLNSYPAASTGYSDVTGTFYDYLNGGDTQGGTAIVRFYSINANSTERTAGIQLLGSPSGGTNVAREMAAFYPTEVVMNDASADQDFRVESDTNTHALFVDAGNSRIGINNSSPSKTLSVTGVPNITNAGFSFVTSDKQVDSGTGYADFTYGDIIGDVSDNVSGIVIISVYRPTSDASQDAAGYVGLRVCPRGVGGVLQQISSYAGSGISTFTVATNSDGIRVTTDTSPTLRCRLTFLGGGGVSVPAE